MGEKNYHSRLLDISLQMDHVIEKLKSSYIDKKLSTPWILWLFGAPLRDLKKIITLQNGLLTFIKSKAVLSVLPILTTIFGPWILSFTHVPNWGARLIAGVIGYLICLLVYFPQLTSFKSEHFHLGAYKTLRAQEYELLKGAFLDAEGEFYFRGLYDYITSSKEGYKLIEGLIHNFIGIERTDLKAEIVTLKKTIDDINASVEEISAAYDKFTEDLISERDELLSEFGYVITLLKDLNTLLFRMHNKGLELRDLNLLTGFTLYEMRGKKLHQIADVGTSGNTPTVIGLNDPHYAEYGVVKVIKDDLKQPFYNYPYEGHIVISFKMNLDNKKCWVYNFHFDESNSKAWKLLIGNGTIEAKEIYRLIHAFCLLSQDENSKGSEGAVNQ
jgi:hypothetical protein